MDCKVLAFLSLLIPPLCYGTDIFVSHEQGQTSFSDIPSDSSEKIELQSKPYRYLVKLKRVIDGDTIELTSGEKVRLIGINTPEIASRYRQSQQGGEAAKTWLQSKLASGKLYMEYDAEQYDKYQRVLAHLYLDNHYYVNAEILQAGLAVLTLTPPNLRYQEQLIQAQSIASKAKLGVWSYPDYQLQSQQNLLEQPKTGIWQRWRVNIESVRPAKKYIRLMISDKHYISISKKHLDLFPDMESYQGKTVEVRGWASKRNDRYVISVQHPSALIVN